MKKNLKSVAVLACSALMLSSCAVYDYPMYTSASVGVSGHGWSTSVSWSDARYDVNGFPIYGYYYGQPVYGYTSAGVAIFSVAALTAACLVPNWGPAPWYCGHWRYPRHVHRVARPPHCPAGHYPGRKPPHRVHHAPSHHHRPAVNHRPSLGHKPGVNHKPGVAHRPSATHRPGLQNRPGNRPKPQINNRPAGNRPQQIQRPGGSSRPQMNRPTSVSRPQMGRPRMNRPASVSRPRMSRPASVSRPRMSRPSGHSRGPSRGHGGGHRR